MCSFRGPRLVPDVVCWIRSVLSISEGKVVQRRGRELSSNVSCVGRLARGMVPPSVWVNFYWRDCNIPHPPHPIPFHTNPNWGLFMLDMITTTVDYWWIMHCLTNIVNHFFFSFLPWKRLIIIIKNLNQLKVVFWFDLSVCPSWATRLKPKQTRESETSLGF